MTTCGLVHVTKVTFDPSLVRELQTYSLGKLWSSLNRTSFPCLGFEWHSCLSILYILLSAGTASGPVLLPRPVFDPHMSVFPVVPLYHID